jgi:hypothetical protein
VPDYSTVSRRQKTLQVAIGVTPTTTGLHLLVDSTGIKMLGEGEWKTKKHGADYRRQWRKVHLGIDASTLEIRAMEDSLVKRSRLESGRIPRRPSQSELSLLPGTLAARPGRRRR